MISLQFLAQSLLEISYSNLPHLRIASWDSSSEEKSKLDPGVRKKAPFQGVKMAKKGCHSLFRPVHMYKKYILKKKLGQNGHSSSQQWSEQSTAAYMVLPPPTR